MIASQVYQCSRLLLIYSSSQSYCGWVSVNYNAHRNVQSGTCYWKPNIVKKKNPSARLEKTNGFLGQLTGMQGCQTVNFNSQGSCQKKWTFQTVLLVYKSLRWPGSCVRRSTLMALHVCAWIAFNLTEIYPLTWNVLFYTGYIHLTSKRIPSPRLVCWRRKPQRKTEESQFYLPLKVISLGWMTFCYEFSME